MKRTLLALSLLFTSALTPLAQAGVVRFTAHSVRHPKKSVHRFFLHPLHRALW